jgi:hypothetical protein
MPNSNAVPLYQAPTSQPGHAQLKQIITPDNAFRSGEQTGFFPTCRGFPNERAAVLANIARKK